MVTIDYDQTTDYKSEYNEPDDWSDENQSDYESKESVKMEA